MNVDRNLQHKFIPLLRLIKMVNFDDDSELFFILKVEMNNPNSAADEI